ncbi:MAG: hypothetical protein MI923_04775 [Phycisphaerales bacterium]|nr:hypothetical protein [Phycisphaerales bacterium]
MTSAASRSVYHQFTAILSVLLILNLHVWLGGCGNPAGIAAPVNTRGVLSPDHPLVRALENSALVGATGFEIDSVKSTFQVIFVDETHRLNGKYAQGHGGDYTITELAIGRQGDSVTLTFDLGKRVTSIRTGNGVTWQAPAKTAASSIQPSSAGGTQAYVDANVELLNLAREVDRQSGISTSGQFMTIPGSGETVDLTGLAASGSKTEAALIGSVLLFIFSTTVLIWAPILGTLQVLLSIFLVTALIQQMISGIEPPPMNPVPMPDDPPEGDPPAEITDCNDNGVDDANDIADGDSSDCNGNSVPDDCESDTDGDGTIDECDFDLTVTAESDRAWVYEHLNLQTMEAMGDATNCLVAFSAAVTDDPFANDDYTFEWSIEPPADRSDGEFLRTAGAGTNMETYRPPERPGFSPSGLPYVVTVLVRGNQHGNEGTATFTIDVRILGDVDNSGCVDLADDAIISSVEQGLITDPDVVDAADVNCDGTTLFGIDSSIVGFVSENLDGLGACVSP